MGWMNDPIADSPSPTKANGDVSSFIQQYGPVADKISEKLGVSPDLILGKLGLETAWGKKVIPGTNNLGNIKDVSGRGTMATDNYAGSRDAYLKFEDPDTFGAYYSDFIQRLYPNVVGAGSDASKFTAGLAKGKNGSYAEDPNYGTKVSQAAGLVSKARGGSQGGWMNDPANEDTAPIDKVERSELPPPKAEAKQEAPKAPMSRAEMWKEEGKKVLKRTDDLVRGLADTLTFGYADEIAAKLDSLTGGGQTGKTNYEDALKAQRQIDKDASGFRTGGQVIGGLIPVVKGVQAAQGASRLARAGAGALTGGVQGALYGSGSAEGDLADRGMGALKGGATGIALGGTVGAVLPATRTQQGNEFIKRAGGEADAALNQEILQRAQTELSATARNNMNGVVKPLSAKELNSKVTDSFIREGKAVVDQLPKDFPNKKLLSDAMTRGIKNTQDELNALQNVPGGKQVADIIFKAQRADALTAPIAANKNLIVDLSRKAVDDVLPIPGFIRRPIMQVLDRRQTREMVSKDLLDRYGKILPDLGERLGPSKAAQSLGDLSAMAQKAQASRQAMIAQQQAAKTQSMAQRALERNQILQTSRTPLGGGFQELLQGGRSGLNMTTDDAVKALRVVSKMDKNSPVSKAAKDVLQSGNVKDPNAFYGVQNTIRRLSEEGKIAGSTQSGGVLSSGVRNPISYQANVNNAMEAVKLARDSAPTKALGQFASTVAGTKSPAEKLKLVEARLAKATDPAEIDFLNNFVRPLTSFGKK